MPHPATLRPSSVDRTTVAFAVMTVAMFGLAAAARAAVEWATGDLGAPVHVTSTAPRSDAFDAANTIATFGACAAGVGVLLFGATLVLAVRRHRARRLPLVLGTSAGAMVVGAVVAGIVGAQQHDFAAVADWSILRTALCGLAAASLPALGLATLRARADRSR